MTKTRSLLSAARIKALALYAQTRSTSMNRPEDLDPLELDQEKSFSDPPDQSAAETSNEVCCPDLPWKEIAALYAEMLRRERLINQSFRQANTILVLIAVALAGMMIWMVAEGLRL